METNRVWWAAFGDGGGSESGRELAGGPRETGWTPGLGRGAACPDSCGVVYGRFVLYHGLGHAFEGVDESVWRFVSEDTNNRKVGGARIAQGYERGTYRTVWSQCQGPGGATEGCGGSDGVVLDEDALSEKPARTREHNSALKGGISLILYIRLASPV